MRKLHPSNLFPYLILSLGVVALIASIHEYRTADVTAGTSYNGKDLPIYCVQTDEKKISLTFDAAWGNEDTQTILDTLAQYDVKVTFFMTGSWVQNYPDDVKAILEAGHDLGNHSQNHKNMSQLSSSEIADELLTVHQTVKELTGYDMFLFRPPYGDYDNLVITEATACGYYPIQWDVDSLDWKNLSATEITERVLKRIENGSIILCHNQGLHTAEALPDIIKGAKAKGYEFVPIGELIYRDNYRMSPDGAQVKLS